MNEECYAGMKPERNEVDADGVRISYSVWGDRGQDMVMLHGITSSAMTWWRVAPAIVRLGYRVTAPDMPGHGDSERPDCSYALGATAQIVDAFMALLGIRHPIVMGHSWSGGVTLVHATAPDTQVVPRSIVLVDPLIRIPQVDVSELRDAMIAPLGKHRREQAARLRETYPQWHECDIRWKAEALEKGSPSAVRGVFADNTELDLIPYLSKISGPWAVFAADPARGGILPHAMSAELSQAASNNHGEIFNMPEVGHDIHREDYSCFMSHLETFLAAI